MDPNMVDFICNMLDSDSDISAVRNGKIKITFNAIYAIYILYHGGIKYDVLLHSL